jgi:hypothetical protein
MSETVGSSAFGIACRVRTCRSMMPFALAVVT